MIDSIHNQIKDWEVIPNKKGNTGVWLNIAKAVNKLSWDGSKMADLIKGKLGDGQKLKFWMDNWAGNQSLNVVCPNLFKLERHKNCKVKDRLWRWEGRFR